MAQLGRAFLNLTLFHVVCGRRKQHFCHVCVPLLQHKPTDVVFECTPDGEDPSFTCEEGAVTLVPVHSRRLCTWETHSCPTVSTSPWTRPGLDAEYAPPPIRAIKHLHHLPAPRDPPAVCSCDGTAESSKRSSLDLAQNLTAPPMHVCGGAQRTATCSAYGE